MNAAAPDGAPPRRFNYLKTLITTLPRQGTIHGHAPRGEGRKTPNTRGPVAIRYYPGQASLKSRFLVIATHKCSKKNTVPDLWRFFTRW